MIYDPAISPVRLVVHEATLAKMTPAVFLASRRPKTTDGKRRLCFHLNIERGMNLHDVGHWMDCDPTTVSYHVRNYRQVVLGHTLLRTRARDARLPSQPQTQT